MHHQDKSRVPTSVYLDNLLDGARDRVEGGSADGVTNGTTEGKPAGVKDDRDRKDTQEGAVSIHWIMEQLGERSFGLTLFVMAIVAVIPGGSTIIGVLIAWPALQLAIGRSTPLLPGFLSRRTIGVGKLSRTIRFVIPRLQWIEKLIKPRWTAGFAGLRRPTGVLILLLGLTLISPFPFSHLIPALTIMLLAVAFLEEDGIALLLATGLGLASLTLSVTQIWGAVEFLEWMNRLLD